MKLTEVKQVQNRLISLRKYKGYTQTDMAKLIDVDLRTYQNKEHGVTQFKANEMFTIAREFQMGIGDIFLPTNFMNHEVKEGENTA